MINSIPKPRKVRSKKLRESAEGEACTLRIPGICNGNPETTVLAHLPGNKGTGTKNHDLCGVYACSSCHDWMDGRVRIGDMALEINRYKEMLRAWQETLVRIERKNLININ